MRMQALSVAGDNKDLIRSDPLQRMHTMHNLADLLATKPAGIARTLRDDSLAKEAGDIAAVSPGALWGWGPWKALQLVCLV